MKIIFVILSGMLLFPKLLSAQYSPSVRVTGHEIFSSVNAGNSNASKSDMIHLDYKSLFKLTQPGGGIIADINTGGRVALRVYAYDEAADGGVGTEVYRIISTETSTDFAGAGVPVTFDVGDDIHVTTQSTDIKKIAQTAKIYLSSGCLQYAWPKLTWTGTLLNVVTLGQAFPPECVEEYADHQPVIVVLEVSNATVHRIKISGIGAMEASDIFDKFNAYDYKSVNRVVVHELVSGADQNSTGHYQQLYTTTFNRVNQYYLNLTGMDVPDEVLPVMDNTRINYDKIDVILYTSSLTQVDPSRSSTDLTHVLNQIGTRLIPNAINIIYVPSFRNSNARAKAFCKKCTNSTGLNGHEFILVDSEDIVRNLANQPHLRAQNIAHEIGHYLNLKHPFISNECGDGDGLPDTPVAQAGIWWTGNHVDCNAPPSCNDVRRQIENIMDYGPCRFIFTKDQNEVMQNMLLTHRSQSFSSFARSNPRFNPGAVTVNVTDLRQQNNLFRESQAPLEESTLEEMNSALNLYPNPTSTEVILEMKILEAQEISIEIVDAAGRLQRRMSNFLTSGRHKYPINLEDMSRGTYIIRVNFNGHHMVETIILE